MDNFAISWMKRGGKKRKKKKTPTGLVDQYGVKVFFP